MLSEKNLAEALIAFGSSIPFIREPQMRTVVPEIALCVRDGDAR